jgi:uncharacterized protein HemX
MKPRTTRETVIICVAAVLAVIVLTVPFELPTSTKDGSHSNNSGYLLWIVVAGVIGLGMYLLQRYLTIRKRAQIEVASSEQYRKLADEFRRLSDMAITIQEHTDLKLGDLSAQLDYLREQNESMQKILKEVE